MIKSVCEYNFYLMVRWSTCGYYVESLSFKLIIIQDVGLDGSCPFRQQATREPTRCENSANEKEARTAGDVLTVKC